MQGCAEILQASLDTIRADPQLAALASGCVQADAILRAGADTARASWTSSLITAAAGLLAVIAAGISAVTAWRSVQTQIAAEQQRQRDNQAHSTRRQAYLRATEAMFTGVAVARRLADLSRGDAEVMAPFERLSPKFAQAHLVASLGTDQRLLTLEMALVATHRTLLRDRASARERGARPEDVALLAQACEAALRPLLPMMIGAIGAMRGELGFDAREAEFHEMISGVVRPPMDESRAE